MKQLVLMLLLIPMHWSYAQEESKHFIIDGHYSFTFYGDERQIRLWPEAETFVEYDAQGNQLGNGQYLNINGESFLYPETVGQYSLINGSVQFKVVEITSDGALIRIFLSDGESENIILTKL